jgi:hypothetical protein
MKTTVSSYQIETSHTETEYDINRLLPPLVQILNASIIRIVRAIFMPLSAVSTKNKQWDG